MGLCVKKIAETAGNPLSDKRLYDHDLAIASRETRIHLNNVAYFFSAFHKDNLSSILLPTISIFCSEWERSIVCVK